MSVELLNLLKYEAKIESDSKSAGGHWIRRKEALRAKRGRHGTQKLRNRRQIDTITSITEGPDLQEKSTRRSQPHSSRISAEWSGATGGPPAEVVLRLHPPSSTSRVNASLADVDGSGVVVRAEEALIVAFVLLLWVAAIALFFNRWGKIRCVYKLMLEPYQPKFQQQHRQSCALAENSVSVPPHHRASLSRGCVSYDCGASFPSYQPCGYLSHRPRQNSVFVSSMGMGGMALIPESPPRRSRSAADIPALITPSEMSHHTPRSSRAASLHSAVDIRVVPSPRTSRAASLHSAVDMPHGSVQVHVRGSGSNLNRPRSPRRLTITNV
ncbi:uncharacterized protein LOC118269397 isoform X2 [Spodoptera frugiperda]|uniref:Uncharacterized protein LOC118269397 isoform X2 n=1 Tax=Spodoptera frugiperda TaxID=7108 RepID=A0A9R0F4S5_SPOFR|nr:uncharacterized protein LOC118269397 isoform X2 [Spodoptera frugiperda]